jgi:hypothetical protein
MYPGLSKLKNTFSDTCFIISGEEDNEFRPNFKLWAPVTACATDFVTEHLLQTDDTMTQMRIVDYVQRHFKTVISNFQTKHGIPEESIHFIFKGGNVMRFIMHAFMAQQPQLLEKIKEKYMDVFKASDLDFGIVIDPKYLSNLSKEDIHTFTDECNEVMKVMRGEMVNSNIIPAVKNAISAHTLMKTFYEMNKKVIENNIKNPSKPLPTPYVLSCMNMNTLFEKQSHLMPPITRRDMIITFVDEDKDTQSVRDHAKQGLQYRPDVRVCESKEPGAMLFVSCNKTLLFPREGISDLIHFNLVRIKLAFEATLEDGSIKKIGGEVVDLSIPMPDGVDQTPRAFKNLAGHNIDIYKTYRLQVLGTQYSVQSYSVPSLIYDLVRCIFIEVAYVWEADKYLKRVKRIMGLMLCEAFIERSQGVPVSTLRNLMFQTFNTFTNTSNISYEGSIWKFVQSYITKFVTTKHVNITKYNEINSEISKLLLVNLQLLAELPPFFDIYSQTIIDTPDVFNLF